MIFLEQTVKQILREEGQVLLSLSDLGITWDSLEQLFVGTYEQAKSYISIYDWVNETIGQKPKKANFSHIRHITYNTNNLQRFLPDIPQQYWEFNPYTKNLSSLMNMNFSLEVGKYPTLDQLTYDIEFNNVKKGKPKRFTLPFTPTDEIVTSVNGRIIDLNVQVTEQTYSDIDKNQHLDGSRNCPCGSTDSDFGLEIFGDITGNLDLDTLSGSLTFNQDYDSVSITFLSKYLGIKELDMNCELFYNWFKSNVLMMLGSIKSQIDLSSSGLPFDFNSDALLDRAKELRAKVDELKINKSHWSNF